MRSLRYAFRLGYCALLLAAGSGGWARANDVAQFPDRMVRLVVPFAPGSNSDAQARILADKLTGYWKQTVIVENRPGLAGTAGAAKLAPDGYNLIMVSSGHPVVNVLYRNLPFDPLKDFAGVTPITAVAPALVVPPSLPANTVGEFVALAKAKPGQMNFSSSGINSTSYLAAEVFRQAADIDIVHLPYKGAQESIMSVVRGDAQLMLLSVNLVPELVESGKLKALAVTSEARLPSLPNLPTVAESGFPGYVYQTWFGVLAPAGTPRPLLEKISEDIARVLRMPDLEAALGRQGLVVYTLPPNKFDALMKDEAERFGKVLKQAGAAGAQ